MGFVFPRPRSFSTNSAARPPVPPAPATAQAVVARQAGHMGES